MLEDRNRRMRQMTQIPCALLIPLPYAVRSTCGEAAGPSFQLGPGACASPSACCGEACPCAADAGLQRCPAGSGGAPARSESKQAVVTHPTRLDVSFEPLLVAHPSGAGIDLGLVRSAVLAAPDAFALRIDPPLERLCTLLL